MQEIAERMSGNICRCSAYPNIVNAISQVLENTTTETPNSDSTKGLVTGIWSPPPSEAQLSKPSANNKTSSTKGDRS